MKKLGIIGFGNIGKKHFEVFQDLGHSPIASSNRNKEGRDEALAVGVERTYADYQKMIETENLDGIICSPSLFSNFSIAKDILRFGIPILLEKPPGSSKEELEILIRTQQQYNTVVQVATNRIWYSVYEQAIEKLNGLNMLEGVHIQWSENPKRLAEGRGFSEAQVLTRNYTNSIHAFSLLNLFAGEILQPDFRVHKTGAKFDYNFMLQGVSNKGVSAQFISSWSQNLPWTMSIYGNDMYIYFAPMEVGHGKNLKTGEEFRLDGSPEDQKFKPGFYNQAKHFLQVLDGMPQKQETTLKSMRILFGYAAGLSPLT